MIWLHLVEVTAHKILLSHSPFHLHLPTPTAHSLGSSHTGFLQLAEHALHIAALGPLHLLPLHGMLFPRYL